MGNAPIVKTEGIVLKRIEVSNTSTTVVWLTRDHGRLATLIKGAQRPKSFFLGRVDVFYTCELLYYARDREHLHFARECSPLRTRPALRRRWKSAAVASYWCDLVQRVLPWGTPQPVLYDLLDTALDAIAAATVSAAQVYWFELRVLDLLGQAPRWDRCVLCGSKLPVDAAAVFSAEQGGLICQGCRQGQRGLMTVPPDRRALLGALRVAPSAVAARRRVCNAAQIRDLDRLLGGFLRWHLDLRLDSRDAALETLAVPLVEGRASAAVRDR